MTSYAMDVTEQFKILFTAFIFRWMQGT